MVHHGTYHTVIFGVPQAIFLPLRFGLWPGVARPWALELPTDGGIEWGSYSCDLGGWMETTTWHLAQNAGRWMKMASHASYLSCWGQGCWSFFVWLVLSRLVLFRTFLSPGCPAKDELIDWEKISLLRSEKMACDPAALIETGPSLIDGSGGFRWDGYNISSFPEGEIQNHRIPQINRTNTRFNLNHGFWPRG